jgi:hypothetical protein
MTNTKTKIAIASLLAVTLSSSAFAGSLYDQNRDQQTSAQIVQTNAAPAYEQTNAYQAFAQAPAHQRSYGESNAERRAFDRSTAAALSR